MTGHSTEYDIIIVGAGTAGSFLAKNIEDKKVLVLDGLAEPLVKDSGIVSADICRFFPKSVVNRLVEHKINHMRMESPSGISIDLKTKKPFAFVLDRQKLGKYLRSGIDIKHEFVRAFRVLDNHVYVRTDSSEYSAGLLVAADGANSVIRQCYSRRVNKYFGVLSKTSSADRTTVVYLNKYYSPDFYAWSMLGEHGLITSVRPADYLSYFEKRAGMKRGQTVVAPVVTGLIKTYYDCCLLLGDAACHVKPITGGGIVYGLKAAGYAADVINNERKYPAEALKKYEMLWKKDFGHEIRAGLWLRSIYRKMTNKQIDQIFREFGSDVEAAFPDVHYDHLSDIFWKLPKKRIVSFMICNLSLFV